MAKTFRKYEPIAEEDEEIYSSQGGQEKEISRPKSKTKLEKDKENMKKQKTKLEKEMTEISLSSSKTDDEKELLTELTESESNSSN